MGLDITAYSKLEILDPRVQRARERLFIPQDDPVYEFTDHHVNSPNNWMRDMKPGKYYETPDTETLDFRAGSYSGYNAYRKMISECFLGVTQDEVWNNEKQYEGKPFYEQVNFSDCEGFIGPEVSAKLAKDYKEGRTQWYEYLRESGENRIEYYMSRYDLWTEAFELASDDGFVWFC
jgi:hypothetical protein